MFGQEPHTEEKRCQSCGMPISVHSFGTNASGSMNFDYCMYCFQKGGFTEPDITKQEMIRRLSIVMSKEMGEEDVLEKADAIITGLKRWRNLA
ncbi:MAG: zinc ribbon domain-containing protein [Candidatus Levyibacteriota bacterium]